MKTHGGFMKKTGGDGMGKSTFPSTKKTMGVKRMGSKMKQPREGSKRDRY